MSGINLIFGCTCTSKKDCTHFVLLPKKERCGACRNYGVKPELDECHCCEANYPCCVYDEDGYCTSSVAIVNKLVLELQKVTGKKVTLI